MNNPDLKNVSAIEEEVLKATRCPK